MHATVYAFASAWLTVLLGVTVVAVIRARSAPTRILALDMLVLVFIALLVLLSLRQNAPYLMDAALVLALLSFVATLAAARYHAVGRLFS